MALEKESNPNIFYESKTNRRRLVLTRQETIH